MDGLGDRKSAMLHSGWIKPDLRSMAWAESEGMVRFEAEARKE